MQIMRTTFCCKDIARLVCCTLILLSAPLPAAAEDFTNAIRALLQQRVEVEKKDIGIVVGIVDEHGSSVVSCGKMDGGDSPDVNGDTLFEIGSVTKTFTVLLLEDMIERGEMKLDDPVSKYLPKSVRMPTRNGKEITLLQLATHTSGLPNFPNNLDPKRANNPFADYTDEKLYAFLSGYKLTRDPGAKYEYSSLGMGLLGQVIALKAGTNYESLVVDRICRPLKMDSTRITLTPELKSRFTTGHNQLGDAVSSIDFQTLAGAGALRSTANDMLKYLSANLGLTPSRLTPLMEKTHVIYFQSMFQATINALAWSVEFDPQGREIISHGGTTFGCSTFVGFDNSRRRGVVVLSNSGDFFDVIAIGRLLLESEWQSDRRPKETKISSQIYDPYVGQYRLSPNFSLGVLTMRLFLLNAPKAVIWILAGFYFAELFILLWRATSFRRRWIILGWTALVSGLSAALIALILSQVVCALFHPVIGIRREGDRLFTQAIGLGLSPNMAELLLLPPITTELLPESETRFFNRLTGTPVDFFRDAQGKVNRLTERMSGAAFSFAKISDQPPKVPEPPQMHAVIKLDAKLLDACVGQYKFAPDELFPTGMKLTISRQGDRLIGQASGKYAGWGALEIYPESETNFFGNRFGAKWTFIKDDNGEVTALTIHGAEWLHCEGRKVK
jgi:CubicO group peptidase (beta-lactamase class C family)